MITGKDLDKAVLRLDNRQRVALNSLNFEERIQYLGTFLGRRNKRVSISKPIQTKDYDGPEVSTKPGQLMDKLLERKRLRSTLHNDKKPEDKSGQWVGVEIECYLKTEDFDGDVDCTCECTCNSECDQCGHEIEVDCDGSCRENCECTADYIPSVRSKVAKLGLTNITVVSDGSLETNSERFGVEFKVLFKPGKDESLKVLCAWLKYRGANVDTTCGLHVHLDCTGKDDTQVLRVEESFVRSLPHLVNMIPSSRRNNTYCKYGKSHSDRYHMINCTSLKKHKTIEIRMHSGTTCYTKISNWVSLLVKIKDYKHDLLSSLDSLEWGHELGLSIELQQWVLKRMAKFSSKEIEDESEAA
jgi:hypothetical protein